MIFKQISLFFQKDDFWLQDHQDVDISKKMWTKVFVQPVLSDICVLYLLHGFFGFPPNHTDYCKMPGA